VAFWDTPPAGFDFSPVRPMAANTGYPVRFDPDQLLSAPATGCRIDLCADTPPVLRLDTAFTADRPGTLSGVGGWFTAQLSPSTTMSNSPLDPRQIHRRQVFFPIEREVPVDAGDLIDVTMRILPDDLIVSWTVDVTRRDGSRASFAHSTLKGMLLDPTDLRLTDPGYRPSLTGRGVARRSVLELCDGSRTLAQIEAEVFVRHRSLFRSAAEAAIFVSEVVSRYTHDAT
jgi:hypothetical protein